MGERREISTAVPCFVPARLRLEPSNFKIQCLPGTNHPAPAKRRRDVVAAILPNHRLQGKQIRLDRTGVVVNHLGIAGVGEDRKVVRAVRAQAMFEREQEIVVAPGADAGPRVGRDVGAVVGAEGGLECASSRERCAFRFLIGVATDATGGTCKVAASYGELIIGIRLILRPRPRKLARGHLPASRRRVVMRLILRPRPRKLARGHLF